MEKNGIFALACAVALASQAAFAGEASPVTLVKTIYMPEITGDFDRFTVDLIQLGELPLCFVSRAPV